MATVTNREELKQYCLRALGSPLINIDITDEQMEDRIDEAISYFREYYFDGIEKVYLKHQLKQEDIDNRYIELPSHVWAVNRVFPYPTSSSSSQLNIFDLQYQLRMNDLRDLTSTSMIYYQQVMSHISLIDYLLNTQKQFRFNKLNGKLYIDDRWNTNRGLGVDQWLIFDAYTALNPDDSPRLWNERLFKEYTIALFKKQWGGNLSKYQNVTLPGGITLDGQRILDEGKQEQEDIENQIMNQLSPLEFYLG
jgi:hypothetical protein